MNLKFKPLSFPRDNKTHKAVIEWWYFNGHLWDKDKKHYSFMNCLFKTDIEKFNHPFLNKIPFKKDFGILSPYVYFSHSVLSDISGRKTYKDIQNISLVSRDSFRIPDFRISAIPRERGLSPHQKGGDGPVSRPLCLRNAGHQTALLGRAQWWTDPGHQREIETVELGRACIGRL